MAYIIIGETNQNHHGTKMKIISLINKSDMNVQFLDEYGYIKRHVTYTNFIRGNVKNPYDKTVSGIGFLGDGDYVAWKNGKHTPVYLAWKNMIDRCYCENKSYMYPAYFGICTVSSDWHNFQVFAKWYFDNWYEVDGRLHIDKDILVPGNKEYGAERCILLPQRINMLFVNKPNKNGLPNGIRIVKNDKYSSIYNEEHLGEYNTLEEAYAAYAIRKEQAIKDIANEYKEIIPLKLYHALLKYKVSMLNDKNLIKIKEDLIE